MDEIINLSNKQLEIINANEDYILVVACPGSGKTHTLISKYIYLINNNIIKPSECILITFTKKAGQEMLSRLKKNLTNENDLPYHVGSLHSLSYKLLELYNIYNNKIILDDKDIKILINEIIYNNIDDKNICNLISSKIINIIDQTSIDTPFNLKKILKKNNLDNYYDYFIKIYNLYINIKNEENIIDFNDLMIDLYNFLSSNKSIEFKKKIKYIFFDEYQDINNIQNNILLKFAKYSKLFLVGDDAQSIYSFRGSSVKYILNFNKYFNINKKTKKIYLLEENYRSINNIVNLCQDIINYNKNQINKKIISKKNNINIKPLIYKFSSKYNEYNWIVNDIKNKINNNINYKDIVILARKNSLLDEIELNLIINKIPIIKNINNSLLNKEHIKDFISLLIYLINPQSSVHKNRINNLLNNNELISQLNINCNNNKIDIIKKYFNNLWKDKNKYQDLLNLLKYCKNTLLCNFNDIINFINNMYLEYDTNDNDNNSIFLTTIHGSKGLEWKYVYLIDVNINDFPFIKSKNYIDELEEIEEERRLLYVALSRAQEYLYITCYNPSSLIKELINFNNSIEFNQTNNYELKGIINNFKPTLNLNTDIINYLNINGYYKLSIIIKTIINEKNRINKQLILTNINIKNIVNKIINKESWDDLLIKDDINFNIFLNIEKYFKKINNYKVNYNISYGGVNNIIDIFYNDTIYLINYNMECVNIYNICLLLLSAYLFKKNNININYLIIYNPIKGIINKINITNIDLIKFKKIIYNN
jgi:DNA helicase-2/ATP-dependent DNA helicase PcrA